MKQDISSYLYRLHTCNRIAETALASHATFQQRIFLVHREKVHTINAFTNYWVEFKIHKNMVVLSKSKM